MKQCKRNLKELLQSNKGFSLVELLTSLTIFAFFSIALLQFMNTAAFMSKKVNGTVNLGMQSTVALGMIEEYMLDCSGMVSYDAGDQKLIIINNYGHYDPSGPEAYIFQLVGTTLYFSHAPVTDNTVLSNITYTYTDPADAEMRKISKNTASFTLGTAVEKEVLSEHVNAFEVTLNEKFMEVGSVKVDDGFVENTYTTGFFAVDNVQIVFQMSQGKADYAEQYVGESFISLRNAPVSTTSGILN